MSKLELSEIDLTKDVLVMLSAGMESATALEYFKSRSAARVGAIFVNVGQLSSDRQLAAAKRMTNRLGVPLEYVDARNLVYMFVDVIDPPYAMVAEGSDPLRMPGCGDSCMVMQLAGLYGATHGYSYALYGATSTDLARVPRLPELVDAVELAVQINTGSTMSIVAPFLGMSDEDVATLAIEERVNLAETWSCHWGNATQCGTCERCEKRGRVFAGVGVGDPTTYAS